MPIRNSVPDDKRFGASERQGKSLLERHFVIHREHGRGRCGFSGPLAICYPV